MEPRSPGILPLAAGILGAGIGLMASCLNPDQTSHSPEDPSQPNVVLILADDMGYGDAGAFNAGSAIATPAIDTLAGEGLRFTDAHSPGAWCVPSRYGLLTGQAPWRVGRFHPDRGPVLGEDLLTLPGLLKERGYRTAMVGKWHLGFEGGPATAGEDKNGGPLDRGFDLFYGIHASLDIPPYYYVRDRRAVAAPPSRPTPRSSTRRGRVSRCATSTSRSTAWSRPRSATCSTRGCGARWTRRTSRPPRWSGAVRARSSRCTSSAGR